MPPEARREHQRRDTVGIVGAGAFGTALGSVLARAGRRVVLWSRDVGRGRGDPDHAALPAAAGRAAARAARGDRGSAAARERRALHRARGDLDQRARSRARAGRRARRQPHRRPRDRRARRADRTSASPQVMEHGLPTLKIGAIAGPALPADLAEGQYSSIVVASAFDEVVAEGRRLLNAPPVLRVYGTKDLDRRRARVGAVGRVHRRARPRRRARRGARAARRARSRARSPRRRGSGSPPARRPGRSRGSPGLGNLLVRASDRSADYQLGRRLADGVGAPPMPRGPRARAPRSPGSTSPPSSRVRMPVLQGVAAVLAGRARSREVANLIGDTGRRRGVKRRASPLSLRSLLAGVHAHATPKHTSKVARRGHLDRDLRRRRERGYGVVDDRRWLEITGDSSCSITSIRARRSRRS